MAFRTPLASVPPFDPPHTPLPGEVLPPAQEWRDPESPEVVRHEAGGHFRLTMRSLATASGETQPTDAIVAIPTDGYLTFVSPARLSTFHGRVYVLVELFDGLPGGSGASMGFVWAGYVTTSHIPSTPNVPVRKGWFLSLRIVGNSQVSATDIVVVHAIVSATPAGQSHIEVERPGTGPGEGRTIALGDPAAGADYAVKTVPTVCLWRLRGFAGPLVSGAAAANREPRIEVDDGTNAFAAAIASLIQTATLTVVYRSGALGVLATSVAVALAAMAVQVGLPDGQYPAGFRINFVTANLQGADDWGPGFLRVEEWAVPSVY